MTRCLGCMMSGFGNFAASGQIHNQGTRRRIPDVVQGTAFPEFFGSDYRWPYGTGRKQYPLESSSSRPQVELLGCHPTSSFARQFSELWQSCRFSDKRRQTSERRRQECAAHLQQSGRVSTRCSATVCDRYEDKNSATESPKLFGCCGLKRRCATGCVIGRK
jgi:hypothetical protein